MDSVQETESISARPYQVRLFEHAISHNSIIYLPTGSGKTYIAILLLKYFAKNTDKPLKEGGKRCIFMCSTVELARQTVKEVAKTTNFKVALLVGEMNVDNWLPEKWENVLNTCQVLIGTSQVFVDMISHNRFSVSNISCAIIDECHHATKSHPMHAFLSLLIHVKKEQQPRVVGLTGVLLKSIKGKQYIKALFDLEAVFQGKIITVKDINEFHNVLLYSTCPREVILSYYDESRKFDIEIIISDIVKGIKENIQKIETGEGSKYSKNFQCIRQPSKVKQIIALLNDFEHQMHDMGLYAASIAILGVIVQLEVNKRNSETVILRNMYRYVITQCECIRHILIKKIHSVGSDSESDDDDMDASYTILNFSKPKLQTFLQFLLKEFSTKTDKDIHCLVFVQRRLSAKCLCHVIRHFVSAHKKLSHIIPDFMVGRNTGICYSVDNILDSKWFGQTMERFRTNESNLIVCSNVLEEGIDVQACNYVIAFDKITHFTSYIQMKGRARSRDSMYVILCDKNSRQETALKIEEYNTIDKELKKYLVERTIDREIPDESRTLEQFSEKIKPFKTSSGAILKADASLTLLHRYCQTLPRDVFTQPMVIWSLQQNGLLTLQLPLQSRIKDIIMPDSFMNTVRSQKISAAFKACLLLYKAGELDNNLLPVTKKQIMERVSDIYFAKWKNKTEVNPSLAGTKKNQRVYEKLCPNEWIAALPAPGELAYAYCIHIEPEFTCREENKHIFDLLRSESSYAILVRNKMPALAAMPLYMTQGRVLVEISSEPILVKIQDENQLRKLKMFHKLLFSDIVKCWKRFLAISDGSSKNSFLIAPVTPNRTIDWEIVSNFQELSRLRAKSIAERQGKKYNPNDFLGKIVNQWHNDKHEDMRYVVTKIRTDLNPLSPFSDSSEQFRSYAHFVEAKYGQQVCNKEQFLMEVKPLTSRLNFFVNSAGKSIETKRSKKNIDLIFIPEMCHNFHFPGDLWLKALLLPSIIHRVYYLLHAERLRVDINKFLGIASNPYYKPKPIEVDFSLRRVYGGEIENEYRKTLPPLESTRCDSSAIKCSTFVDVEQGNWKKHVEPVNIYGNVNAIYPIEVDYYYQFVNNLLNDFEKLNIDSITNELTTAHTLEAYKPKKQIKSINSNQKAIEDNPNNENSNLIGRYINSFNNSTIEQFELLSAITTASANDVFDMERFEVLGDSFLKLSSSLLLMHRHPDWHEGFLTATKSRIVSNRNLLYCMQAKYEKIFICSSNFEPSTEWLPPMATIPANVLQVIEKREINYNCIYDLDLKRDEIISGACEQETLNKLSNTTMLSDDSMECLYEFFNKQSTSDKVVADCLEAILGVCVRNYGVQKCFEMLDFFGIYNNPGRKILSNLLNINLGNPLVRANISQSDVDEYLINYQHLEMNLNYKFKDRAYLLQALTHSSFPTNRLTGCYQQLEFIGDAILDFLISCYIFERCKHMDPGQITDLRSALVNNVTLACICVRNRFHLFMLHESPVLGEAIKKFVEFQETQDHRVSEQVKILLEETNSPDGYNIAQNIDVPKALGDVFEAIIGAIFLDSNNDLLTVWNVINHLMTIELNEFIAQVPINPVRQLFEYRGANPKFTLCCVEDNVTIVECKFYCRDVIKTVNGCGSNKSMAKKAAAKMALQFLYKS